MTTAITCTFLYMPVYQSSQLFVPYLKCCCWLKLLSKYFGRRKCLFSWSSLAVIDFQLLVFGNYSFFFFFNAISTISNLAHTSIFFSLCRTYVLSWRNWFLSNRHVLPIFNFDTFFLLAHAIKWLLLFFNYCSVIWNCITKQAQHVYPFVAFLVYFGKWVRIWLKS